jgi:ABC-2 type transport system ATP-binding protein
MGVAALRTENLSKRFGRLLAVDGLDLTVEAGEVFGFLGPNGAGKSTTIRLALGLVRPTAGRAWVFGADAADVATAHRRLAHVPADVALWPRLTGAETLELLGRTGPGVDAAYRDELVARFDLDLSRPAGTYSTGNRQKVALVAAFATRAPLLVLDEPTSGLDPLMEREFRAAVRLARDRGQAVFLSSHQLAEVEAVCDRVAILRSGRLIEVATVADLPLPAALAGAANQLPIPLLCIGAAVLALGIAPRMVGAIGSLPAIGGFIWQVVADSINAPPWTLGLSPFTHLAVVPAETPNWPATATMLAIAAALTVAGLWAYRRRDLRLS